MGGIIYFLSLEEPSQPLTSGLWGLRGMQRTIAASPVSHEVWDRLGTDSAQGQAWGGWEETVFTGKWQKKGFWGELPRLWALWSYLCIYLANFGQKRDSGGHLFRSPDWTQTPPPFSAGCPPWHLLPNGLSSLLKPASLCQGLETLGTDIQKLFSLESVPITFYTSPDVLHQAGALPVSQVLPLMLLGCWEWGRAIAPRFL